MTHVKRRNRICGTCRETLAAKGQWRCQQCHAIYMRAWRKKERERLAVLESIALNTLLRKHAA